MKNKKGLLLTAVVTAATLLLGACGGGGQTIIQQGDDTKVSKGTKDVVVKEQDFTTKCLDVFDVVFDEEDGLYIYTKTKGSIPYVLIWRHQNVSITIADFIQNYLIPDMQETYGDRLLETSEVKEWSVGGTSLPGVQFVYTVGDSTVTSLRVFRATPDGFVSFNMKYVDEESSVVRDALDVAVKNFKLGADNADETGKATESGGIFGGKTGNLSITKSEAASVKYTKYKHASGYFSMDIPTGWVVEIGLKPDHAYDIISYAITVYDPAHPERQLYFNLNCVPVLKSKDAHDWYATYYPNDQTFATLPWLEEQTTAGFFKALEPTYGYTDFEVMENQGKSITGGEVLVARSTWNGVKCEGLYTAMLDFDSTYYVSKNPMNLFSEQIDAWPVTAYTLVIMNAAEDEIIDWKPVLDHCLSTIEFTESFQKDRKKAWDAVMGTSAYVSASSSSASSAVMDSWEKRNASYDVISQKQSDATLGYERVYDTETQEYYRAENGFSDWYQGDRYVPVSSDSGYLQPVTGVINWK